MKALILLLVTGSVMLAQAPPPAPAEGQSANLMNPSTLLSQTLRLEVMFSMESFRTFTWLGQRISLGSQICQKSHPKLLKLVIKALKVQRTEIFTKICFSRSFANVGES